MQLHNKTQNSIVTFAPYTRFQAIVDCAPTVDVAADIGCDHGYIAKALLDSGRASRVIASDISGASLRKAHQLARDNDLQQRLITRQGDGLHTLATDEVQLAVLAGMGGMLMVSILSAQLEKALRMRLVICVPNRNEAELRMFLAQNGFGIMRETLAFENHRYYQVICACAGQPQVEDDVFYYEIGRKLLQSGSVHLPGFLHRKLCEKQKIQTALGHGQRAAERMERLQRDIDKLSEVLAHGKCE